MTLLPLEVMVSLPASAVIVTSSPEFVILSLPAPAEIETFAPEFEIVSLPASASIVAVSSSLNKLSSPEVPVITGGPGFVFMTIMPLETLNAVPAAFLKVMALEVPLSM